MKKDFLSLLFYAVSAEKGTPSEARAMNQLYERTQLTRTAWDPIQNLLSELGVKEVSRLNALETAIAVLADAFEEQGFINGFRLGMMLREELARESPQRQEGVEAGVAQ